jgi:hypothetical protein
MERIQLFFTLSDSNNINQKLKHSANEKIKKYTKKGGALTPP